MANRLTSRRVLTGYAVWMALLLTANFVFTGAQEALVAAIDISGTAALVTGIARNSPVRRAPWLLLAGGNLTGAFGLLAQRLEQSGGGVRLPFSSYADCVFLAGYPLYAAGLFLLARSRREAGWRGRVDLFVVVPGLALLSLLFLIGPDAADPAFGWARRLMIIAYPVGDLIILLALTRLLTASPGRGAALVLLTSGMVAGMASDVGYALIQASAHPQPSPLLDLGTVICYVALGAAALHPSMAGLTRPGAFAAPGAAGGVVVPLLVSMVPPVALFVDGTRTRDPVEGVVAVTCGVVSLLMLSRLWDVAASHRRGLMRERTLRVASSALASARSVEEIAGAVKDAAAALVPGTPAASAAFLGVREGDYLRSVDRPGAAGPPPPLEPSRIWLHLSEGRTPRFVSVADIRAARFGVVPDAPAPDDPPLATGFEGGLLCPLTLQDRAVGDSFIGLLGFFGDRRTLADLAAALEILAGQAALAVERVELTQEVVRQRSEALFRTLVQDASDVILIVGDDRRIRYATPSAVGIFGAAAAAGARLTDLVTAGSRGDLDRVLDLMLSLSGDNGAPGYLLQVERLDRRPAVLEVRWSDLRSEPTVGGLVLTLRDVTEQHELEQELKFRAFHDALTGLPNRVLFAREAAAALEAARAAGRTAGVLFVDLDDFKVVNDTMGHGVGDELLVAVASRLADTVRESDTAARLGGDEFALLIDDAADVAAVDAFAQRIVEAFAEPVALSEAKVIASVTVGVATSQDSGDVDELLRHADLALYAAKSAGKRRWRHYQPVLTSGMMRRREIQDALEDAVHDGGFTLVYQPIVSLASGEIDGFESLIRWSHPEWGMMLPSQFISLAEETGLIVPLGAWILRQAVADMARWRRELPADAPEPHVSVNVSARQFRDPGFADSVRRALLEADLPASALLIELTESLLLGGNDRVRADLNELKDIGAKLAIDDFGTGYSSLSYLLELPIDVLKVDKAFVTGIASSWRRHALVEGIIRLARTLEVDTIAEGIESETERELLAQMGCQFGQGYLLSVPVDADTAGAMLRQGRNLVTGLRLPRPRRQGPGERSLTEQ
jgi:diguanylate cyclase (GGDEF)-like protein/PAS domain S-box-containing protein